jgi:hypothetical protein
LYDFKRKWPFRLWRGPISAIMPITSNFYMISFCAPESMFTTAQATRIQQYQRQTPSENGHRLEAGDGWAEATIKDVPSTKSRKAHRCRTRVGHEWFRSDDLSLHWYKFLKYRYSGKGWLENGLMNVKIRIFEIDISSSSQDLSQYFAYTEWNTALLKVSIATKDMA